MRIVGASSEAVPFSKTGGLADVATALADAIASLGHSVWLVSPFYPQVLAKNGSNGIAIEQTGIQLEVPIGNRRVTCGLLRGCPARRRRSF